MNESKSIVIKKKSRAGEIWRRFRKNKLAIIGMILFAIIMLITILADVIVDYNAAIQQVASDRLLGPCAAHPLELIISDVIYLQELFTDQEILCWLDLDLF